MSFRSTFVFTPLAVALLSLSGCGINSMVYRADVHQGNLITQEMVDQLETGMSRSQVQFLLGEPLLKSQLHQNRWDYTYYFNPRVGAVVKRDVTVFFDENDRMTRLQSDPLPTEKQADAIILGEPTDFKPTKSPL